MNEEKKDSYIMINENNCVICFEVIDSHYYIIFDCNHSICLFCYEKILNIHDEIICPLCRAVIEINNCNNNNILEIDNTHAHNDAIFVMNQVCVISILIIIVTLIIMFYK